MYIKPPFSRYFVDVSSMPGLNETETEVSPLKALVLVPVLPHSLSLPFYLEFKSLLIYV